MAYSKTTNFTLKDTLLTGDPNKIVRGSEIDTEFDNIEQAFIDEKNNTALTGNTTAVNLTVTGVTKVKIDCGTY